MARQWIATRPGDLEVLELVERELAPPGPGEVRIAVRAAGVNPADAKHVARGRPEDFPRGVGYEVAGVVVALGPGAELASGGGAVGDEVLAFRIAGGWADEVVVPARDVFAKPASLGFAEAANLLLAGATAADLLRVAAPRAGETVLVHGASGAVGVSVLQQAARRGVRVIGTASEGRFEEVRRFGGEPVTHGDGLAERVRDLARDGVAAALDCVGTEEALDVSLALVSDRDRVVTIAAQARAGELGIAALSGTDPVCAAFRDSVRAELVALAGSGELEVPVARTYPLADAVEAAAFLQQGHPGGKLALLP